MLSKERLAEIAGRIADEFEPILFERQDDKAPRDWLVAAITDALEAQQREIERKQDALSQIKQWCDAYPLKVFAEPDFEKAGAALATVGITLDALHGTWGRRLLEGVGKIATDALAAAQPGPTHDEL